MPSRCSIASPWPTSISSLAYIKPTAHKSSILHHCIHDGETCLWQTRNAWHASHVPSHTSAHNTRHYSAFARYFLPILTHMFDALHRIDEVTRRVRLLLFLTFKCTQTLLVALQRSFDLSDGKCLLFYISAHYDIVMVAAA